MTSPLASVADVVRDAPTLLDVRWRLGDPAGHEHYLAAHLPGAAYVDLETDLAAPPGAGGRHPLPDPGAFAAAMRRAGVRRDHPVVVYDDWGGLAAARAWWLLRFHGHPEVRLLDGGLAAWRAAGGALETGAVTPPAGDLETSPGGLPVVDADRVLDAGVLLDARAPERYRGEQEPVDPVAGHLPGAVNLPATGNLAADGRGLDPASLRARYAAVGARPGADVAVYCGSGVTAAHDVLALAVIGVPAALYPGSWSEWVGDPVRPVATGP